MWIWNDLKSVPTFLKVLLVSTLLMTLTVSVVVLRLAKQEGEQQARCTTLCAPNPVNKVRYGQCFCDATVVVKPLSP